ncbi:MAG: FMN-binding glutamate synthase family protein, partial [candidate division WOR-3 bacterium]
AAMVGKTIGKKIEEEEIPVFVERFGNQKEEIFVTASSLKRELGKDFDKLSTGAIGVYTYIERLSHGLRQLMCGNRKFALDYITRDDIAALTKEAAEISGIPYVTEVDKEEVEKILNS